MVATLPLGATVPVLGLSNKAVFEGSFNDFVIDLWNNFTLGIVMENLKELNIE